MSEICIDYHLENVLRSHRTQLCCLFGLKSTSHVSMSRHLILYSTNTWLAYIVAERFYNGIHYVWCSPYFDIYPDPILGSMPPTSNPSRIYRDLSEAVKSRDRHCKKIEDSRYSILTGAVYKEKAGVIDSEQLESIFAILTQAEIQDFRPLLYIIPFEPVADIVEEVPHHERANPAFVEYRVESLPRSYFDVIEFDWR